MQRLISAAVMALALALPAGTALARDLAVLVLNDAYENLPNVPAARRMMALEDPLRAAGYDVEVVRNFSTAQVGAILPERWRDLRPDDRMIVVLAGHVVGAPEQTWLLASDAQAPDAFNAGRQALSLEAVMHIGALRPGKFLLAVADNSRDPDLGFGLRRFAGWSDIPQGVGTIRAAPPALIDFLAGPVLTGDRPLFQAARDADGVRLRGYASRSEPFQPPAPAPDPSAERAFWDETRALDTIVAYERYLTRYPDGRFADRARARLEELRLTPQDRARLVEEGLNLTRPQRRAIQSNLAILGFDPRGIDGIFGPGTRAAISAWQRSIAVPDFGYLNANQISRLQNASDRRRRELDAEAERRRQQLEAADRAYWAEIGAGESEHGLRLYLERYPDGMFADEARARLAALERDARRRAEVEERQAWDRAVSLGTLQAYQAYAERYPEGLFIDEARSRIRSLSTPDIPPELMERDRQEEAALNLNTVSRQLIEQRLAQLNYNPGQVDGRFTPETRRALRRYQRDNRLAPTGYVTRITVARLITGVLE